jgi:hypothetical protein
MLLAAILVYRGAPERPPAHAAAAPGDAPLGTLRGAGARRRHGAGGAGG